MASASRIAPGTRRGSGLVEIDAPTDQYDFTHSAPSPDGKTVLFDVDPQGIMAINVLPLPFASTFHTRFTQFAHAPPCRPCIWVPINAVMSHRRFLAVPALAATTLFAPVTPPRVELFAPGVVSTRDYERDGTFSPDGKTLYFAKRTMWPYFSAICVTHLRNGKWSEPEVAPFSGRYADATPSFSPDGSRLYFASRRPIEGSQRSAYNVWMVSRNSATGVLSAPIHLPDVINAKEGAIAPIETRDGSLFFVSGALGHVVVAKKQGNSWSAPALAGDSSASGSIELSAYVDPDQRYMIVSVVGREDALHSAEGIYPRADLYVRTRKGDEWSSLRHLGAPINSSANELAPFVSPDGRYLYFTSERGSFTEHGSPMNYDQLEATLHAPGNGLGDIYRVELSATGIVR